MTQTCNSGERRSPQILLSFDEEVRLARRIRRGDAQARKKLIEANFGLVRSIVNGFSSSTMPWGDMFQEGCIGLIKAAEKFNPDLGYRFSTYASIRIRRTVQQAMNDERRSSMHLSRDDAKDLRTLQQYMRDIREIPELETIEDATGINADMLIDLLPLLNAPASLDTPLFDDDGANLYNAIPSDEHSGQQITAALIREDECKRILSILTEQERTVIQMRLGFIDGVVRTNDEIGSTFHVSGNRIREIANRAFIKMRSFSRKL